MDRVIAGLPTLLAFHVMLVKRKYQQLFSPKRRGKPGPKGPSAEMIEAIAETYTSCVLQPEYYVATDTPKTNNSRRIRKWPVFVGFGEIMIPPSG